MDATDVLRSCSDELVLELEGVVFEADVLPLVELLAAREPL